MAINVYNIRKWIRMCTGKSILHVNQNMGTQFIPGKLNGYFNNLTEKVTLQPELLENSSIPTVLAENGENILFPVAIFQYGLGSYDLYLSTHDSKYLEKFRQCSDWAIENQEPSGAWNNFFFIYPNHPYGAMCQGEAASLLIRAYKEFSDEKYYIASKAALDFMTNISNDSCTQKVDNHQFIFLEYTHRPVVLNGWIFALFGLYDFLLIDKNFEYETMLKETINTLITMLELFDCGYWSMYDLDGRIASPFYHKLHIAQMKALFLISGRSEFQNYAKKWEKNQNNWYKQKRAFLTKVVQKIKEK